VKLFVWQEVLYDYTPGMIVALAADLESALKASPDEFVRAEMGKADPVAVIEVTADVPAQVWYVHGGG